MTWNSVNIISRQKNLQITVTKFTLLKLVKIQHFVAQEFL